MGRYIGELGTDAFGITLDEGRLGVITLSAAQAATIDDNYVLPATTGSALAIMVTNPGVCVNPPYARNLVVTPGGTTAGVPTGNVTITGTNLAGEAISEDFAFTANATAATVGAKAFSTVTSVSIPVLDEAGATFQVGYGDKIGLPLKMAYNAVLGATLNGVRETTFPTVAYSSSALESNTVDLNSALDGHEVKIFLAL